MTEKQLFNQFMTEAINKNVELDEIITENASESTNSAYFTLKTTDGDYYSFSLSDHQSDSHDSDLSYIFDTSDDDAPLDDDDYDDMVDLFKNNVDVDMLVDCEYYSFNKINQYDLNLNSLIGKYNESRAFVSNSFKIAKAELIYDNHFLKISYVNLNNDSKEIELYTNYVPKFADETQIATIKYLIDNPEVEDVHEARKLYYQDTNKFAVEEYTDQENNDDNINFIFNGREYVARQTDLDIAKGLL